MVPVDPATRVLPDLDPESGVEWDRNVMASVYTLAAREGVERREISAAVGTIAEISREPRRWTPAELGTHLRTQYGLPKAGDMNAFAGEAFEALGQKIRDDLTRSGMIYHPRLFAQLARIGEKLLDATAPQGLARLQKMYSEP